MKKIIIIASTTLAVIGTSFLIIYLTKKSPSQSTFLNTIPLINKNGGQANPQATPTIYPPINPAQTNYETLTKQVDTALSGNEKDKIIDLLPVYIKDFTTGTKIKTTINVFTLLSDPAQSIRIEIYGPDYNNQSLTGEDAKAFVASFQEVKGLFASKEVNFQNLQIIYGNRQYIQDTASYWAKTLNLLD